MAAIFNVNRDRRKPPVDPTKLHPFARKKAVRQATPEEVAKLLGPDWHTVQT